MHPFFDRLRQVQGAAGEEPRDSDGHGGVAAAEVAGRAPA